VVDYTRIKKVVKTKHEVPPTLLAVFLKRLVIRFVELLGAYGCQSGGEFKTACQIGLNDLFQLRKVGFGTGGGVTDCRFGRHGLGCIVCHNVLPIVLIAFHRLPRIYVGGVNANSQVRLTEHFLNLRD
jgi:hypothetical protein